MSDDPVVVIGAGAAGIAAGRTLHDAGAAVLLVEASDRLGGRAHSIAVGGFTVDLGCGWLHSARRNPWTAIAEANGVTIDRSPAHWHDQWGDLGFSPAEQQALREARQRWQAAAMAARDGPDRPLSAFLAADDPWQPMIDAISGYANGDELAAVSFHDWAAYEEAACDDDWALPSGYGTLVAGHAAGVPTRLGTPVTRIDRRGMTLRLDTPGGTIDAAAIVVCVPTSVLARAALVFDPPLPAKHDAAAALPLGLADKVFLRVDDPPWPAHAHLIGEPRRSRTASHRLSPFGWPIVESFLGSHCVEAVADERSAMALAIDELVTLLGSNWRARLHPLTATRWRQSAWIGSSYSHALVGQAGQRAVLAEPVEDRIFFAGEACSADDFSTAHGAYATGVAAADAVLAARKRAR